MNVGIERRLGLSIDVDALRTDVASEALSSVNIPVCILPSEVHWRAKCESNLFSAFQVVSHACQSAPFGGLLRWATKALPSSWNEEHAHSRKLTFW